MKENKEHNLEKTDRSNAEQTRDTRVYVPTTDIYEKADSILVRCDMPGVPEGQVDIRLENTNLEITGTQISEKPRGMELLMGEYDTGVFHRKFNIPQMIDRDKIKARLSNGVLDIELPKAAQAKPRKIKITTGEK